MGRRLDKMETFLLKKKNLEGIWLWDFCEEQAVTLAVQLTCKASNWQKEFPVLFFNKELHAKVPRTRMKLELDICILLSQSFPGSCAWIDALRIDVLKWQHLKQTKSPCYPKTLEWYRCNSLINASQ